MQKCASGFYNQRQFEKALFAGAVINALHGLLIILRLGKEYIGNESLRVSVVERKPTGLHLNHDAMAR